MSCLSSSQQLSDARYNPHPRASLFQKSLRHRGHFHSFSARLFRPKGWHSLSTGHVWHFGFVASTDFLPFLDDRAQLLVEVLLSRGITRGDALLNLHFQIVDLFFDQRKRFPLDRTRV